MSNWTHVAAVVRLDSIPALSGPLDAEKIFGKTCLYDSNNWSDAEAHPEEYLPMGSEGSLEMNVWNNPDTSSIASTVISIFGDLRDHDSAPEIVDWFKGKLKDLWVRQAVITVENEQNGSLTWTYTLGESEER